MKNQRRWTGVGLTCAVVAAGLSAFTAAPAMGADSDIVLRTGALEVHASSAFPQVVQYIDRASGAVMRGNDTALASIEINGAAHPVTVTHTLGVYTLGVLTLLASAYLLPEQVYPWLGVLSGLIVVTTIAPVTEIP